MKELADEKSAMINRTDSENLILSASSHALIEKVEHSETLFPFPERKYEMNELSRLFLGRVGKVVYEIALCFYLYGSLWSYSTVFAESMASHVPLPINGWYTCNVYSDNSTSCDILYKIYVGVYALIVVPMTCLNLTEQKPVRKYFNIVIYYYSQYFLRNYSYNFQICGFGIDDWSCIYFHVCGSIF